MVVQASITAVVEALTDSYLNDTGGTVLDPFCGSGSTLVAARELRRHFVGIELDARYHAVSAARLNCCL